MTKKIFIISGAVFVLAVFSSGVFYFLNKKQDPIAENQGESEKVAEIKDESVGVDGQFAEIIKGGGVVAATWLKDEKKILFYRDKRMMVSDTEGGNMSSIGAYPFNDPVEIKWSARGDRAVVYDAGLVYSYDLSSNQAIGLKKGIEYAEWNQDGRLVYKYYDDISKNRSLNMADHDGGNWKEYVKVPYRFVSFVSKPGNPGFGYYPSPDAFIESELKLVDSASGEEKTLVKGFFGADFLWSPDGKKLLISSVDKKAGNKMILGVANENGGEYKNLDFPTTIKKCVWSADSVNVYCAVLSNIPNEAVMPNNWQEKKFFSADTFWKINTENGKKDRIIDVSKIRASVDGKNFFLDDEENNLFFIDRKSGSLFRVGF